MVLEKTPAYLCQEEKPLMQLERDAVWCGGGVDASCQGLRPPLGLELLQRREVMWPGGRQLWVTIPVSTFIFLNPTFYVRKSEIIPL